MLACPQLNKITDPKKNTNTFSPGAGCIDSKVHILREENSLESLEFFSIKFKKEKTKKDN